MSTGLGLIIMAEVAFILFIIWGFANEEHFVAFERRIVSAIASRKARRKLRLIMGTKEKGGKEAA